MVGCEAVALDAAGSGPHRAQDRRPREGRNRPQECREHGLLLAPGDRSALFAGKALGNTLFTLILAAITLPAMAVMLDEGLLNLGILLAVGLGVVAYSGAGTLVATIAISTRAREVVLPILLLPITLPLVTAAVLSTGAFLDGGGFAEALPWLGVEVGFLIVFWSAGILLYEFVLDS